MLGADAATHNVDTQDTSAQDTSERAVTLPDQATGQVVEENTHGLRVTIPGLEIHRSHRVWLGEFTVRQTDLTLDLGARIDLDRLIAFGPTRWAVAELAAVPEDLVRAERLVAAARAALDPEAEPGPLRLCALEIDGAQLLGGLLLLFEPWPAQLPAYLLTPDLALADLLAARRARAARALVAALRPTGDPGGTKGLEQRSARALGYAADWISSPGQRATGTADTDRAIVRVPARGSVSALVRRGAAKLGHRAGQVVGRVLGLAAGALVDRLRGRSGPAKG